MSWCAPCVLRSSSLNKNRGRTPRLPYLLVRIHLRIPWYVRLPGVRARMGGGYRGRRSRRGAGHHPGRQLKRAEGRRYGHDDQRPQAQGLVVGSQGGHQGQENPPGGWRSRRRMQDSGRGLDDADLEITGSLRSGLHVVRPIRTRRTTMVDELTKHFTATYDQGKPTVLEGRLVGTRSE